LAHASIAFIGISAVRGKTVRVTVAVGKPAALDAGQKLGG
jgi:hypothetical protein